MGEFYGNQYTETPQKDYTYDDLVTDVESLAERIDETPTTRDAMEDDRLPCLERIYDIAPGSWQDVLEDAGVGTTQVERYGPEEERKMIRDIRRAHDEVSEQVLTTRDFDEVGSYPTSVVKDYFGSWGEACQAAGVEYGRKHGTRCTGPAGESLDSKLEQAVAQYLSENQVEYEAHPSVPETDWIADFYLPESGLWIEVDGYRDGNRPNATRFQEKLAHYQRRGMAFEVVTSVKELNVDYESVDSCPRSAVSGSEPYPAG